MLCWFFQINTSTVLSTMFLSLFHLITSWAQVKLHVLFFSGSLFISDYTLSQHSNKQSWYYSMHKKCCTKEGCQNFLLDCFTCVWQCMKHISCIPISGIMYPWLRTNALKYRIRSVSFYVLIAYPSLQQ
jgi:hypothetical protein